MNHYKHPLTSEPREDRDSEETHELNDVDVAAHISTDGKRIRLTVTDQDGEKTKYRLAGLTLNGVPITADRRVRLYGVDAVIEWQNGGLGMYPGVDIRVTRD